MLDKGSRKEGRKMKRTGTNTVSGKKINHRDYKIDRVFAGSRSADEVAADLIKVHRV